MFTYRNKYHNYELVLDSSDQVIDQYEFEHQYWNSIEFGLVSGKEDLPPNMHAPHGSDFVVMTRVDAEHAGDTVKKHSRLVFLIYVKCKD